MKLNHLYLFVFTLSNILVFAQKTKPNTLQENLKGNVKSMHFKTYEAEKRDGKIELKNANQTGLNILSLYNNKGYLTEEKQFTGPDDKSVRTTIFKYDSKNLIIEELTGDLVYKYRYVHQKNNTFEIIIDHGDSKQISSYDKNGNKISETSRSDKKTYYNVTFEYDQFQNLVKENYVNEYKDILEYDNKRNKIKMTRSEPNGKLILIYKTAYTKYDKKGNWTESVDYNITNSNSEIPLIITKREINYY